MRGQYIEIVTAQQIVVAGVEQLLCIGKRETRKERNMNEETKLLLQECTSGCKMATDSLAQMKDYISDDALGAIVEKYISAHKELEVRAAKLLESSGKEEKKPDMMASAFSWITTEMKLMVKDNAHQIAKIIMNGCNMGIQSISECSNKYTNADVDAKNIAKKLVKMEEELMQKMKVYL